MVRVGSVFTGAALVAASLTGATAPPIAVGAAVVRPASAASSSCQLNGQIQHVIYVEFDNTHFMRDIGRDGSTNVPSDLEQMPQLAELHGEQPSPALEPPYAADLAHL
jgi:hypothetical protein